MNEKIDEQKKAHILKKIIEYIDINPEYFFFNFVYTQDPGDKTVPIKKMPNFDYIKVMINLLKEERLVIVMKSRQMMCTWLLITWCLWVAITKPQRQIFFVSKKERDAGKLVERANFIFEHLPKELQHYYGVKDYKYCQLDFGRTGSRIMGVSSESDALRMYTASIIFSDEMAFQNNLERSWEAMKPTIDSGGQFIGVSSPNGRNFFYKLCFDIE